MTETVPLDSRARAVLTEPGIAKMARIPEGWFLMGSEAGQDNERPVHRVWIDAFELAVCQVTNAEYGLFLATTQHPPPLHWGHTDFSHPEQPVVGTSWFDAVAYCEWLSRATRAPSSSSHRGGMGARCSRRRRAKITSVGRRAAGFAPELRRPLEDRTGACGACRKKCVRYLRYRRERPRMVLGLV